MSQKNNSNKEIEINISVIAGTANLKIGNILRLGRGAVVGLDKSVDDYVDIYANNTLIAHGEVVVSDNKNIGVVIKEIDKVY